MAGVWQLSGGYVLAPKHYHLELELGSLAVHLIPATSIQELSICYAFSPRRIILLFPSTTPTAPPEMSAQPTGHTHLSKTLAPPSYLGNGVPGR
jgi:hypothetical protein